MKFLFFNPSILIAMFLLSCTASFSQKKETKGFYISRSGDTARGTFADYKQWNYNPAKVTFIPPGTNSQIQLTPLNCSEFHVEDYDTYVRYSGQRMTNPTDFNSASSGDNTDTYDTITTFLRLVGETKKYKFYVYKDNLRVNLYYSDKSKVVTELLQKAYLLNNNFRESAVYKQQLKELFEDETKNETIDNLFYSEESLAAFIKKQDKGRKEIKKNKDNNSGLFMIGGGSINSFEFNGQRSSNISSQDYPSNSVPVAGIGYIIPINRNFDRMFFLPQLKVFSYKHSISTIYNNSYPAFSNTFQSSPVFTLGIHVGYNIINTPNLKVSLAPGAGFTFLIKNKQVDEVRLSPTDSKTTITPLNAVTSLLDMQAVVLIKRKYIIWSSYILPTAVTNFNSTSGKLTSIQLGVGYKF